MCWISKWNSSIKEKRSLKISFISILTYIIVLKKSRRFTSVEPMTSLFDNDLLRKGIVHPTQFLGFEFISTKKFLFSSNETFQSFEKYLNLKYTRAAIEVDSSAQFKICFFQVSIQHFFTIMLKDAWNIRLMWELVFICFNNYYL